MSFKPSKHFVLATIPSFGHIRAESGIVCELIKADPHLIFTILVAKFTIPLFSKEILGRLLSEADLSRIKIVGIGQAMPPTEEMAKNWLGNLLDAEKLEFREAYRLLSDRKSLTCTQSGVVYNYNDVPAPCTVSADFFAPELGPFVKDTTPAVKVIGC
ncbi:hypothetical protein FRB95_013939 [Tulasnella sp. JGI-2019a]|nr:hypothetical protein FRB95_013939 [Tulasnella sp. JGI-2019a]